ncbi:uncharacterized protein LOC9650312 isoform X1 [Selaginella moellendorffii]|uniref:uncharacterized protein LOC9650312 isoform X1 n=1 Tax=Selaginella moellendorffii TaxID=88036 RepID=UPI000D1C7286|nr:uncharacterized protein LOC9650312 isoform X1 [Selaginella moellendorffii]XP_024528873.1 uncharacterized protein LOC9650312 isoform X1 [Selaginella moellendorffii]|eukprot:XP_024528872.1 uncharacterized protein LOC9650312 isoform X1 [Selaginella moellendorffii]
MAARDVRALSPKPWKRKHRKALAPAADSIEIFEGKPTVPAPISLEITPADGNGYLRIVCQEEVEFFVPRKIVEQLKCVDVILRGEVQFRERLENVIRFPDFRYEVLEAVMRFVFIEYIDSLKAEKYWGQNAPRVTFQFEVEPSQVMEIVHAAHFFGIKNLLKVAAAMIAHNLKDVPDVSSMPPDLAWCVAEQFSAQDLFYAEERDDFLSLGLDTRSLWEENCKKMMHDDATMSICSLEHYPAYDEWITSDRPPPTSWKSLYMSIYLQQLADRQDGGTNDSFIAEVSHKGKWVYTHTIRSAFWEWIMTGEGSLSFDVYMAQFPALFSLCLAKVQLGDNGLYVGKILAEMQLLQLLDISETGFTKEAAVNLSLSLRKHSRLQVLRLAYNCILTEGFTAIARALEFARSLKVLDVRENGIGKFIPEEALAALKYSRLKELLFNGNCNTDAIQEERLVAKPILDAVPTQLKTLRLQQCCLLDEHAFFLAEGLRKHAHIQALDLSDNKITAAGACAILLWLQENTSLLELSFANNNVQDSCSRVLCAVMQNHSSLQRFSLMGNYSYGEENLPEVLHAASCRGNALLASEHKRFTLDLRSTDVSYANRARILRQAVQFTSLDLLI